MFLLLYVHLSVCPLDDSESYEQILLKCFGRLRRDQATCQSDFARCEGHNQDPGIFKASTTKNKT